MYEKTLSEIRATFDFNFVPSLVFSEDCVDFVLALINSQGEALAEIMNDFFAAALKEIGVEPEKPPIFSKEQFTVIHGSVDPDTLMLIVKLPKDYGDAVTCPFYSIVLFAAENKVRFFTVSSKGENSILTELQDGKESLNYGDILPEPRAVMEKVLEIIRN